MRNRMNNNDPPERSSLSAVLPLPLCARVIGGPLANEIGRVSAGSVLCHGDVNGLPVMIECHAVWQKRRRKGIPDRLAWRAAPDLRLDKPPANFVVNIGKRLFRRVVQRIAYHPGDRGGTPVVIARSGLSAPPPGGFPAVPVQDPQGQG